MNFPPLNVLEVWMQDIVSGAGDAQPTPPISEVITSTERQTAEERLSIYARAYFARLLDCLRAEFPAVQHAAGEDAFRALAAGYFQAYPSRSYTLGELGRRWSDYLRQTRPPRATNTDEPDFADFLVELARLERCYSEVFDGPGPERGVGMTAERLSSLNPDQFANSRLILHDSVRLLDLQFPCHEYASAVRQQRDACPPRPVRTLLVVFRRDYVVRRFAISPMQFELLSALQRGLLVGNALMQAAPLAEDSSRMADDVRQSFADWAAAPLFREVISPDEIG